MPGKAQRTSTTDRRDYCAELSNRSSLPSNRAKYSGSGPGTLDKACGSYSPCNAVTGSRYRGVSVLTLGMSSLAFASGDPRWATYKQAAVNRRRRDLIPTARIADSIGSQFA